MSLFTFVFFFFLVCLRLAASFLGL